jgi:hypothetical protein
MLPITKTIELQPMIKILDKLRNKPANMLSTRLSWLDKLSQLDELAALKLTTDHTSAIVNDHALNLIEKLQLVTKIDSHTQSIVQNQIDRFVKTENLRADLSVQFVEANYHFCRQSFLSNLKLIELSLNQPNTHQPEKSVKLVLVMRTINAGINMLKWRFFSHAESPAKIWQQLVFVYEYAQENQIDASAVGNAFNGNVATPSALMIQAFMLGSVDFAYLQKQHIDICAKLLNFWLPKIELSKDLSRSNHLFYLRLNKDHAAKRLRGKEIAENGLFWALDALEARIVQSLTYTHKGHLPPDATVSNVSHLKYLHETLIHLQQSWRRHGYQRQRRAELRVETLKTASINIGLNTIHSQVEQLNLYANQLGLPSTNVAQSNLSMRIVMQGNTNTLLIGNANEGWKIINESLSGLGIIANNDYSWVKPNVLMSVITRDAQSSIMLGIVRNVRQFKGNKLQFGIQIISTTPVNARLKKINLKQKVSQTSGDDSANKLANEGFGGVYLPACHNQPLPSLLIPKIEFMPNSFYEIAFLDQLEIVKLSEVVASEEDWVRVNLPLTVN